MSVFAAAVIVFTLSLSDCLAQSGQVVVRPVIPGGSISQNVNESIPVNTIVISTVGGGGIKEFTVTNAGPDETITFTFRNLTHGPNVPRFTLNRTSGALVVSQSLDVDILNGVTDNVLFEITACDEHPPVPECPRLNVSIPITATNDNSPQFSQDINQPRIFADTTTVVGTVLLTASCTDADRGVGEFASIILDSSTPNNPQMWNLNGQTGALTLTQSLDYDTAQTHTLNLRCIDAGSPPRSATATVVINVERNEPPVFATDRYNVTFSREAEVGAVIAQLSCSDNEKQVASYQFFNPSTEVNETFRVNNDGELILIGTLNVCEQSRYEVTVLCLDGLDQTANAIVEIDVDRGRIYFENCNYMFELDRFTMLNSAVGQVTARSNEGGDIEYSLVEDNQFFTIDNNGRILLSNYILLIHGSTFTFEVEASIGSGAEQVNDMGTVTINVQGPLSVLEVIIIAAAGAVLLIFLVLLGCIVGCCCCCHGNKPGKNYYEDVSPSLVPPQAGRASVTIIPSPELTEVPQSGLAGLEYEIPTTQCPAYVSSTKQEGQVSTTQCPAYVSSSEQGELAKQILATHDQCPAYVSSSEQGEPAKQILATQCPAYVSSSEQQSLRVEEGEYELVEDQSRTQKVGEMTSGEREGNMLLLTERTCGEEKHETETTTF